MSAPLRPTRRDCLLAAALALSAPAVRAAAAAAEPRLVALDWGWASTALALGLTPVGVAEQSSYRDWVGTPAIPAGVPDVGLRGDPSFETLAALKPDLILTNGLNEAMRPKLERIAPLLPSPVFTEAKTPLRNSKDAARLLGERTGRLARAEALIQDTEARFEASRQALAGRQRRPLLPLSVIDPRHLIFYGEGSLFGDTLQALGIANGWTGPTSLWGSVIRPVSDLASAPPGDLLVVDPIPPAALDLIDKPGLLRTLCAIGDRRILRLPAAWVFGELAAARRFADLLAARLLAEIPA